MAPVITPVSPSEPFDPFAELMNTRYAQIEAEFTKQRDRAKNPVTQELAPTASTSLVLEFGTVTRIGNVVTLTFRGLVKVANFLCTETSRTLTNIPVGYRPIDAVLAACGGVDATAPAVQRAARATIIVTAPTAPAALAVHKWNGTAHAANSTVEGTISYVTGDPHPAE